LPSADPLGPYGIEPAAPLRSAVPPGPPGIAPDAPSGPAVATGHGLPSGFTQPGEGSARASGAAAIATAAAPERKTDVREIVFSAIGSAYPNRRDGNRGAAPVRLRLRPPATTGRQQQVFTELGSRRFGRVGSRKVEFPAAVFVAGVRCTSHPQCEPPGRVPLRLFLSL
jgi:hypothetical protein